MSISRILKKVAEKSNGKMRVVKVPPEKRPDAESLEKLEREIAAQIEQWNTEVILMLVRNKLNL